MRGSGGEREWDGVVVGRAEHDRTNDGWQKKLKCSNNGATYLEADGDGHSASIHDAPLPLAGSRHLNTLTVIVYLCSEKNNIDGVLPTELKGSSAVRTRE